MTNDRNANLNYIKHELFAYIERHVVEDNAQTPHVCCKTQPTHGYTDIRW